MNVTWYLAPPMDATGEGPHTFMCMISSKPFVLCCDIEKATLRCLPMMQNLQRSSLQYLIPDKAPFCVGLEDLARSCVQDACAKTLQYPFLLLLKHHQ